MKNSAIKVITFDLDNTLWEVDPVIIAAETACFQWLNDNCQHFSTRFTRDSLLELRMEIWKQHPEYRHQVSESRIKALSLALERCDYAPEEAQQKAQQAFDIFIAKRHDVSYFEDTEETLAVLKNHYKIGALTNGNANVKRLSISRYFDFSFSAEQLNSSKPKPAHFIAALDETGVQPHEIVHIGDHPDDDIRGAKEQGFKTIWFNDKNKTWPQEQAQADREVSALQQLPEAIASL